MNRIILEAQHASQVCMEAGDGDPCGTAIRVTDVLETVKEWSHRNGISPKRWWH